MTMNFIKEIFDGASGKVNNESVHLQFQKFSKGEFRNRAIVEAKRTGKGFAIKTSAEFANEFVRMIAGKLGDKKTEVTGAIVSTNDLTGKIDFEEKKQFQGVKRYLMHKVENKKLVGKEMSGKEIISLLNEFPKTFFALSFSVGETILKIKAKAPKSAKPGKDGEDVKADFCSLKTTDSEIAKGFVFEKPDFKEAKIKHTFFIDSIEVPAELKKSNDFASIREKSTRKGRILREANIDGKEIKEEKGFEA